jgi:hypothetical protein
MADSNFATHPVSKYPKLAKLLASCNCTSANVVDGLGIMPAAEFIGLTRNKALISLGGGRFGLTQSNHKLLETWLLENHSPAPSTKQEEGHCKKSLFDDQAGGVWKHLLANSTSLFSVNSINEACFPGQNISYGRVKAILHTLELDCVKVERGEGYQELWGAPLGDQLAQEERRLRAMDSQGPKESRTQAFFRDSKIVAAYLKDHPGKYFTVKELQEVVEFSSHQSHSSVKAMLHLTNMHRDPPFGEYPDETWSFPAN